MDLLQITNDPVLAARCDAVPGLRIFIDLERNGKAERQAGRNTFISSHQMADIAPVRAVLKTSKLMVRVNPLYAATATEVNEALAQGADMLMLPMFTGAAQLQAFCTIVAGRCPVVALLENAPALYSLEDWLDTPGLAEVFVGLNDLHLSLGQRFMFEPLSGGVVDRVAQAVHAKGLRFGFGGIARLHEGLLPGNDVLAEHVRLRSHSVILSRTFHQGEVGGSFEEQVAQIRLAEARLALRSEAEMQADSTRIAVSIGRIADGMAQGTVVAQRSRF